MRRISAAEKHQTRAYLCDQIASSSELKKLVKTFKIDLASAPLMTLVQLVDLLELKTCDRCQGLNTCPFENQLRVMYRQVGAEIEFYRSYCAKFKARMQITTNFVFNNAPKDWLELPPLNRLLAFKVAWYEYIVDGVDKTYFRVLKSVAENAKVAYLDYAQFTLAYKDAFASGDNLESLRLELQLVKALYITNLATAASDINIRDQFLIPLLEYRAAINEPEIYTTIYPGVLANQLFLPFLGPRENFKSPALIKIKQLSALFLAKNR